MVADSSDREQPAFDNSGMVLFELAPGVVGIHTVAGRHTEPGGQAALGRKVEMEKHLAFEDGAQSETKNRFEIEVQPPFGCPVEQSQNNFLEEWELGPPGRMVSLVDFGMDQVA